MKKVFPIFWLLLFFAMGLTPTFGQSDPITNWSCAGIVNGFEGPPNQTTYIVSDPEIKRLDTRGAEFWFALTPKSHPDCKQYFRIGWTFDQDVSTLSEGQSVNVQVFNLPSGDVTTGLRQCYREAKSWAYDGGYLIANFLGGSSNSIHQKPEYSKYWGPKSQYLFTLSQSGGIQVYPVDPGYKTAVGTDVGTITVRDGIYKIGETDAPFGSFCIEISKGAVFRYMVTYLYDGKVAPASPTGNFSVNMQAPLVEHNIPNTQGTYWMKLTLPGVIEKAAGKSLQIVMRFCDDKGQLLPTASQETVYRDAGGYAASTSPIIQIPSNSYALQEAVVWMPYYALNLPRTGFQNYAVYVYAEVYVDGMSVGVSEKTAMNVVW